MTRALLILFLCAVVLLSAVGMWAVLGLIPKLDHFQGFFGA